MIQIYTLTYGSESLVLQDAPEGWNDLKYTIARNETYHGLFFDFSGVLRFAGDGKEFIDTILTNDGFEVEIGITIQEPDQLTRVLQTKVDGVLNFDQNVYEKTELFTSVNFITSKIHQKLLSRHELSIAYNRLDTMSGIPLIGFANEFVNLTMRGVNSSEAVARAVYPFEAFNRIMQVICDLDYNPIVSSVFGRTEYDYVEDGIFSRTMISKGLLMRGWEEAGDPVLEGTSNLNLKFKELFENFKKIANIGGGFIYNDTTQRWDFVIEDRNYFYQTSTILTIEKNNITDLKYTFGDEFFNNKIETGYDKSMDDSPYGLVEYNAMSEFATPITVADNTLNLRASYRADASGIQEAIDNRKDDSSAEDSKQDTDIDEDVFIIDCLVSEGALVSRKTEGFSLIDGVYDDLDLYFNIRFTPARNMSRWGDWIKAPLLKLIPESLRFNRTMKLSSLQSQQNEETETIYETEDFPINNLKTTRWTGQIVEFTSPLTREQINLITNDPYGLIKYWDYFDKIYKYGWVKECSTDRVDRETTWKLYEAVSDASLQEVANNLVYVEDAGEAITLMDGSTTIKIDA